MNLIFFALLINLIICLKSKQAKEWSDDSIPPPTTPTNSPPYPTQKIPTQSWPTDPIPWPPTMSPYQTLEPHNPTSDGDGTGNFKLSKSVIIAITVGSVLVALVIAFGIFMFVRSKRRRTGDQYGSLFNISDPNLAKTE